MAEPILQKRIPDPPWRQARTARLPGIQPIVNEDWFRVDEAYSAQMGLREHLIETAEHDVHRIEPGGEVAAEECLDMVIEECASHPDFRVGHGQVMRPDGTIVRIDRSAPLLTIGRLIQEDICILEKTGDEHVLTAALVCFPASWSLDEKIGKPLIRIHKPVEEYDGTIAQRVQRLFDGVQVGKSLYRSNALIYEAAELFQPLRESDGERVLSGKGKYLRSERQVLRRLPRTGAVVFSIHTYVVLLSDLSATDVSQARAMIARAP